MKIMQPGFLKAVMTGPRYMQNIYVFTEKRDGIFSAGRPAVNAG